MEKEVIVNIPNRINIDIGIPGRKGDKGDKGDPGTLNVADLTPDQLTALKGPKGDPGPKGEDGKSFTFDDLTPDQIALLKGPKGDPGENGLPGSPGKDGKAFTYDDFTAAQLESLKGPKGDKGEDGNPGAPGIPGKAFTYEDFTPDQLESLKGPKGDTGLPGKAFTYTDFTSDQLAALKGAKGDQGLSPNFAFTLEENGDLFVDVNYTPSPAVTTATNKTYDVIWGIATAGAAGPNRGYLEYSTVSGFGKLHLDMNVPVSGSGNGVILCTLPNNAPVPSRLLEVSINANNNSVYIDPNSRNIKGWGVPGNKRYILDIVGFWKEI